MNGLERDDLIRMAGEAGLVRFEGGELEAYGIAKASLDDHSRACWSIADEQRLTRFAALVAAATLKNSVMTDEEYEQAMADEGQRRMLEIDTEVRTMIKEAVDAEREACAKVAEEWQLGIDNPKYQTDCATAIRARGQG
jgi:hypothetical protein